MHRDSTSPHPPKDADKPAPLHWRQRKKLVARRQQLADEAAARKPAMIAAYVALLGGADRVNPIRMTDIERAVDLTLIASELRTAVRLGTAKVSQLTTLEGHADRARRRLNLPKPNAAAAVPSITEYWANAASEEEED
jgi:hypothetical protein